MKFTLYSGMGTLTELYGVEGAIKRAAELGFSGIEFCYFLSGRNQLSISEAKEYKRLLDKYGIAVPCFTCGTSIVKIDEPDRINEENVRKLCEYLDVAATVGSPLLHHTVCYSTKPPKNVPDYDNILDLCAEGCKTVADYAKKLGIKIIYEPQGFVFNGVSGLGPFFERMKSLCDNVGICGDVGNTLFFDEFADELFKKYPQDILNVHIKDMCVFPADYNMGENTHYLSRSGKKLTEVEIGNGDIKLGGIFKTLKEAGYNGYYSIENFNRNDYERNVKHNMEKIKEEYYKVFSE